MSDLRKQAIRLASSFPKGSTERKALLSLVAAFTVPREGYRVQGVGKPLKGTVEEEIGPFWAGGTFVLARRDTSGMRGQQDPFEYVVVDNRGVMTHFFGTVPRAGYARAFYEKHNLAP